METFLLRFFFLFLFHRMVTSCKAEHSITRMHPHMIAFLSPFSSTFRVFWILLQMDENMLELRRCSVSLSLGHTWRGILSLSHSRRKSETEECGKNAKEGVSVLSQKFQNYPAKACAQVMHTLVQWNIINKIHKLGLSHIIKKLSIKIKRNT